ncbi:DUF6357 family protein [Qipengyuania sp. S6317L1]|uniref:DUF6357 family protein n=1 Tax=Qipengyuania sp. S6317L1 TaxID=2926410 RepID=UPI001FF6063A|nr:DUF6357 family protein [Qipengyuania sp. S6317L1]MCK0097894.1 DUF6357 family protein [Qipengyuania sp. S6317L1]
MQKPETVFMKQAWEPYVTADRDGRLIYHLPVESGFASRSFELKITDEHLSILKSDDERFTFLFALLHWLFQRDPMTDHQKAENHLETILLSPNNEVEELLNRVDAQSNGAVSHFAQQKMGRHGERLGNGTWFVNGPSTA